MDDEGTSDVYIRGFFDSRDETKETDTHFRCQDGRASFNYRFVFSVKHPRKDYTLNIQAYDRDFLSSNDLIGEGKINLKQIIEDCILLKKPLSLNKKYHQQCLQKSIPKVDWRDDNTFYIPVTARNDKG